MKAVGFIDYFLHEWHADQYPKWINDYSNGKYQVKYAWGEIDSPRENGKTNAIWCKEQNIELCASIEEVIEKSDVLVVLSPDNPERHEDLSRLALMSGKRVYIDKTFANDVETAKRIFDLSYKYSTPCYTSSALRFAAEYIEADRKGINAIASWGGGTYEVYSIHQIEPIISLLGTEAKRVMYLGNGKLPYILVEFSENRIATFTNFKNGSPFTAQLNYENKTSLIHVNSDFFKNFIVEMIDFFETGKIKVPHEETLAIIGIREAGLEAMKRPFEWVEIKR